MLGHWKNFDELESNLSIDELMAVIKASREKENRNNKFLAAINGVDLEESSEETVTQDIKSLRGFQANNEGFGIGAGVGIMELGG